MDTRCVPAVETAGYVFLYGCFSNITRGFNHGKRSDEHLQQQRKTKTCKTDDRCGYSLCSSG